MQSVAPVRNDPVVWVGGALPGEDVLSWLVDGHDDGRAALLGQLHEDLHQQVGVVRVLASGDTA